MGNVSIRDVFSIIFLGSLTLKILLIGDDSFISRIIIPGFILGCTILFFFMRGGRIYSLPLAFPLTFLLSIFSISAINGFMFGKVGADSAQAYLRILLIGCVYYGSFIITCWGWGRVAERAVLSVIAIHVLLGLLLLPLGIGYEAGGVMRPSGITGRPQLLANMASLGALFSVCVLVFFQGQNRKAYFLNFLLCFLFLIFSATLKNALTVLALIGMLGLYFIYKRSPRAAFVILPLGVAAVVLIMFYTGLGDRVSQVLSGGFRVEVARGDVLESSLVWRALHWRLLIADWYENYFWTGSGLGQVVNMNALTTDSGEGYAAHSDWVAFFVELGPILSVPFIFGFFLLWRAFQHKSILEKPYAWTERILLLMFVIMSAAGNVFYSAGFLYLFWVLAGQIDSYRMNIRFLESRSVSEAQS